ncbi:hypothetical protein [Streptomyces resistomycificus]|uniref:Uncharacterized protein n=1 Tax=Streptomyces resistomycificus TaxID=67356 RepID=A0A0L8L5A2_9ACTN|nr:hypothetical protein [Streptomyces resistomycificus]KOG33300.1 hypothetical protein ADK37_23255 [Streptomyces resistomycificus]KUN99504.1 hypothetical protein AQJ84_11190 [Streptomyces resistomycificus]
MHDQPTYQWPTCPCGRQLHRDELGRTACRPCQERADTALRRLPGPDGLYAQLATRLTPGRGGDGQVVSVSRTAPLPLRLEPLSLMARGGVVTILQTWQVDWHDHFGWRHPRWNGGLQQQLDEVVHALRINLEGAASTHPAFWEFVHEVGSLVRQCERQITGERPERPVAVTCPCGTVLHITVSTPGARCTGCATQYARAEVLDLPLAQRAAA